MHVIRGMVGIAVLLSLAWALSSNRRRFPIKTVAAGLVLQWALAMFVLWSDWGRAIFNALAHVFRVVLECTLEGARFLLGNLVDNNPAAEGWGFVFAAAVLPSIIVFSSLSAIGYHLGILQLVVSAMAKVMNKFMGVSGAESLSAAGNVFVGQTEAPLLVRPYIPTMTESELMALMVGGFATIAGGVMAAYVLILGGGDPAREIEVARHFMSASLMSAPGSLVIAKIMMPETGHPETASDASIREKRTSQNIIHAAANGASDGLKLALNVGAMLIVFIALVALVNRGLAAVGQLEFVKPAVAWLGLKTLNLSGLLGLLFSPVAYAIGIDSEYTRTFGGLLGTAMATNEMLAYMDLAELVKNKAVDERTFRIATYALCGFANFSSIAIQIGGIGGIVPARRADLARLGLRAMLGGAMACWMTGCIAGMLT